MPKENRDRLFSKVAHGRFRSDRFALKTYFQSRRRDLGLFDVGVLVLQSYLDDKSFRLQRETVVIRFSPRSLPFSFSYSLILFLSLSIHRTNCFSIIVSINHMLEWEQWLSRSTSMQLVPCMLVLVQFCRSLITCICKCYYVSHPNKDKNDQRSHSSNERTNERHIFFTDIHLHCLDNALKFSMKQRFPRSTVINDRLRRRRKGKRQSDLCLDERKSIECLELWDKHLFDVHLDNLIVHIEQISRYLSMFSSQDLRLIHQLFSFNGIVQRFEKIFGKISSIIQSMKIIAELLKRHFRGNFLNWWEMKWKSVQWMMTVRFSYRIMKIRIQ